MHYVVVRADGRHIWHPDLWWDGNIGSRLPHRNLGWMATPKVDTALLFSGLHREGDLVRILEVDHPRNLVRNETTLTADSWKVLAELEPGEPGPWDNPGWKHDWPTGHVRRDWSPRPDNILHWAWAELGRCKPGRSGGRVLPDLSGMPLHGHDLPGLEGASVEGANLYGINAHRNNIAWCSFDRAVLTYANVAHCQAQRSSWRSATASGIFIRESDLSEADLSNAQMDQARLVKVWLVQARLEKTTLTSAQVIRTCLDRAQAVKAQFARALFQDTSLLKSNLQQASLADATLKDVQLCGADLRQACLENSRMTDVDLTGVDLRGASLRGMILIRPRGLDTVRMDPGQGFDTLLMGR